MGVNITDLVGRELKVEVQFKIREAGMTMRGKLWTVKTLALPTPPEAGMTMRGKLWWGDRDKKILAVVGDQGNIITFPSLAYFGDKGIEFEEGTAEFSFVGIRYKLKLMDRKPGWPSLDRGAPYKA
jgi:glutamine amidotransferase-like uncharacterized protein